MQIVGWMILLLLIVARPALAVFEGYIEMKMTMKEGAGTMKGQISSVGARTEVEARVAQMGDMPVTMTMLMKFSNPDVVYMLNDATKTYVEINVKDIGNAAKNRPDKEYTVKKLGKEKVAGYVCEHLLLTAKTARETEVWSTKDLVDLAVFREYMQRNRQARVAGDHEGAQGRWCGGFYRQDDQPRQDRRTCSHAGAGESGEACRSCRALGDPGGL